jgi:hypothetical protein
MRAPPLVLYDAVAAKLAPLAPSFLGRRFLAQHDAPPRFVWALAGEFGGALWRPGMRPRSLHRDEWVFDVHCWGVDFEQAYRLRQALVTGLRDAVNGAHYQLGKTAAPLGDDTWTSLGEVLVVSLTVLTDLLEGDPLRLADASTTHVRPTHVDLERPPADWSSPGRLVSKE